LIRIVPCPSEKRAGHPEERIRAHGAVPEKCVWRRGEVLLCGERNPLLRGFLSHISFLCKTHGVNWLFAYHLSVIQVALQADWHGQYLILCNGMVLFLLGALQHRYLIMLLQMTHLSLTPSCISCS
jgi:hypothetical protein